MADVKNIELAKSTFATLCQALDNNNWRYQKDEEALKIKCGARGDDLPMELIIEVDADRDLVTLISPIPFTIAEDKRLDTAVAVSVINNMLVHGSFDYNIGSGYTCFRMTNSYRQSTLGEEVFSYMLYCACHTIDEYNDQLLMISKGILSLEQFLSKAQS